MLQANLFMGLPNKAKIVPVALSDESEIVSKAAQAH